MTSRPPSESPPKGGESEEPEDKVTRGNFESLAKGLFGVSPKQYAQAEARHKAKGGAQRRPK
jgi:hypothetical protein